MSEDVALPWRYEAQEQEMAVVLLSGGLDSAVAAAVALAEGRTVIALTADYGQHHAVEVKHATATAVDMRIPHYIITIDSQVFGQQNSLTGYSPSVTAPEQGRPATYVPARNTVLLSNALALAEATGAQQIIIGSNMSDADGYPDCRPEYLVAFQKLARLATWSTAKLRVRAPLLSMDKAAIIATGLRLGVNFRLTSSCYRPTSMATPCMACDACRLRAEGFAKNGLEDPLIPEPLRRPTQP